MLCLTLSIPPKRWPSALYLATVLWDTQPREVLVLAAEGGSLMGTAMLYGHRVILHVVDNGDVLIDPWP